MREILFRGKTDKGEWVQGCYNETLRYNNLHWIWDGKNHFTVNPETVGQYTGLTDKNGTKIFEGDIVKIHYDSAIWGNNREVVFEEGQWFFKDNTISQKSYIGAWGNSVVEVIGNIHDNPELLEGSVDNESKT